MIFFMLDWRFADHWCGFLIIEIDYSFWVGIIGAAIHGEIMETQDENAELDQLQTAYKLATEEWRAAIGEEEALASVKHSLAEVDRWEGAHFREEELRKNC
jgi:hypothetical protein